MTSQALAEIFAARGGFTADGARLIGSDEAEATLFATLGHESLVIDRVRWVEIQADVVIVATRKDLYVLACSDVRAVRFSLAGASPGYSTHGPTGSD
jgi:hypothetical protein